MWQAVLHGLPVSRLQQPQPAGWWQAAPFCGPGGAQRIYCNPRSTTLSHGQRWQRYDVSFALAYHQHASFLFFTFLCFLHFKFFKIIIWPSVRIYLMTEIPV